MSRARSWALFLIGMVAASLTDAATSTIEWMIGTNQANDRIECYALADLAKSSRPAVRWSFAARSPEFSAAEQKAWRLPSEAKLRRVPLRRDGTPLWAGTQQVILTTSSGGLAAVVSYPEGRRLWSAEVGGNPHTIELLPEGLIAVAASQGNWVRVYDPTAVKANAWIAEFPLEDAHGLWWDEAGKMLWATGHLKNISDVVTAFTVSIDRGAVALRERVESRHLLPSPGPHDLSPVLSQPAQLWIGTVDHGYRFNIATGEFAPIPPSVDGMDLKSFGDTPAGDLLAVRATGGCHEWTTDRITLSGVGGAEAKVLRVDGACFYKVRFFTDLMR